MSPILIFSLTGALGLYMAWNIGANDVANAMGTSVGSRSLSLRRAIIMAGLLEFAGAVLVGSYVTETVRNGIVEPSIFIDDPSALVYGMMSALAAAALWLNVASFFGWPVSTTHAIVGAVAGFGLVLGGSEAINWGKLLLITSSWVISPILGGLVAFGLFCFVRRAIIEKPDPSLAAYQWSPILVGCLLFVLSLVMLFKGLKIVSLAWYHSLGIAVGLGLAGMLLILFVRQRVPSLAVALRRILVVGQETPGVMFSGAMKELDLRPQGKTALATIENMERSFVPLQIMTAASVAFAHGANDVANAVGPMAAVFATAGRSSVAQQVEVPLWILVLGGAGIVAGLATYGYKVMATIGTRITEITPSRGFAAEFGAATTILFGSKLGLPLSTTHTLVGAVIGVGFARGTRALNLRVIKDIATSWVLTVPVAAALAIPMFYLLRWIAS